MANKLNEKTENHFASVVLVSVLCLSSGCLISGAFEAKKRAISEIRRLLYDSFISMSQN